MDNRFDGAEALYRAVIPSSSYIKEDGSISSGAFKEKRGLSVDRGDYRSDEEVVDSMKHRLSGRIAKFSVQDCFDVEAIPKYLPEENDEYHSEIHKSDTEIRLSNKQAKHLSRVAKFV